MGAPQRAGEAGIGRREEAGTVTKVDDAGMVSEHLFRAVHTGA